MPESELCLVCSAGFPRIVVDEVSARPADQPWLVPASTTWATQDFFVGVRGALHAAVAVRAAGPRLSLWFSAVLSPERSLVMLYGSSMHHCLNSGLGDLKRCDSDGSETHSLLIRLLEAVGISLQAASTRSACQRSRGAESADQDLFLLVKTREHMHSVVLSLVAPSWRSQRMVAIASCYKLA